MAGAFSDYRKAVADEQLARTQLERSTELYGRGAISLNDLQVAQDTEAKAKVDVENTTAHVHVLGGDLNSPSADCGYSRSDIRSHHRPGSYERSGRCGSELAESIYDLRSLHGLDFVRCV